MESVFQEVECVSFRKNRESYGTDVSLEVKKLSDSM